MSTEIHIQCIQSKRQILGQSKHNIFIFLVATYFGLAQSIIGLLQNKMKHLYVRRVVFMFLSCGIPHYKIIPTIKL